MAGDPTITLSTRVPPSAHGSSLLAFLCGRFRYHDQEAWRARIADGRVTVGGRPASADQRLARGDVIAYRRPAAEPDASEDVRIVHDAGGILVVDKPAGLPVHGDGAFLTRTVVGVLARRLGVRPRPVHRLDRETSGVCVLARDRATARALQAQLALRCVTKVYDALVHGAVAEDRWASDAWIGRAAGSSVTIRRAARPHGAEGAEPAHTEFTLRARGAAASWIECRPATGRTHQIRVHLEALGHPLLGDKLYGRPDSDFLAFVAHVKSGGDAAWGGRLGTGRHMLHARAIRLADPRDGKEIAFEVPPPEDFVTAARERGLAP